MRIAVISPTLPTPTQPMRGVTRFEQLHRFARAGHDAFGVVPVRRGTDAPAVERDGNVVVSHPRYPRVPRILGSAGRALERRLFARAAAAVLGRTPDVVLAHSATLPGGLLGRIGQALFVVTIHDHELQDWAPHSHLARDAVARTLRGAQCVVYVSEALRRDGTALAGPHGSVVIPIGIEAYPDITPAPPAGFTVCAIARLIARKRIDHLIRVFAQLAGVIADARLVLVGGGPEQGALARLVRDLGLDARVEMTGAVDARTARAHLARASVMALPSVRESLGAAYLEAMSLGVPVIATQGEGIADHIEHGVSGLLVPPADNAALLAELRALAADRERARAIGAAGRERFLAGPFTWEANVRAHLRLFDELLKDRATHTT